MSAVKVTLTLPEELLAAVDSNVAAQPGATRSGLCADALRRWLQHRQEAEIANYYRTRSDAERREDAAWISIAARSADQLWQ